MYLLVPKDEVHRHKLLKILFNREMSYSAGESNIIDCKETAAHVSDISKQLKVSEQKAKELAGTLIISQDVKRCETTGDKFLYTLGEKGYASYLENFYLKRGRSYKLSLIKDNLYIIVSMIAIISAIGSLWLYIASTLHTEIEVKQLQQEVQEMKMLLNQKSPKKN